MSPEFLEGIEYGFRFGLYLTHWGSAAVLLAGLVLAAEKRLL